MQKVTPWTKYLGVFVIYKCTNIHNMKYAILIESKNSKIASLERIAQIIKEHHITTLTTKYSESFSINFSLAKSLASKYRLRFL